MGEIHIYTGGTAGNRDGTLVSDDGSNSNPLNFGNLVVGQESGWIPFAYRSALGRKTQVPPVFKGDTHLKYSKDGGATSPGYGVDLTDDSALGDTNRIVHVKAKVLAGETGVLHPKIIIDAVQAMIDIPPTPTLSAPSITATSPQAKVVRIGLTAATSNVGATITYDVYIGGVLKDSGISAFATKDYTVNAGTYSVYVVAKDTTNSLTQNSNTVSNLVVAAPTLSTPAISATSPTYNSLTVTLNTQATSNAGITPVYDVYIDGALTESNLTASALTGGKTYGSIAAGTHSVMVRAKDTTNSLTADSTTVTGISVVNAPVNQAPVISGVSISGTTTIGSTLTANSTATDSDIGDTVTKSYRWFRNGVVIAGATNSTYALVEVDLGKTITTGVTGTDNHGLTGSEVISAGLTIPIPAPPSLNTPTKSDGKITCTFTANSTLATETYNAYYTTDGTDPTTASTKLTGVTSPFDISATNGLTVKVKLEMVVNGVASALSATVSGVPMGDQVPVINGLSATANATTLTVKATSITDAESEAITEIDVVYSTTGTDNPDTLFAGSNKAVYTAGADITAFTGAGKSITGTFTVAQTVFVWARAKDASGTGVWVQTTAMPLDANTLAADGFEGTINPARVVQSGTGIVMFTTTNPISGSKSLLIDKDLISSNARYNLPDAPTNENIIRVSIDIKPERFPTASSGVDNIAGIGKEWGLPLLSFTSTLGGNALQCGLSPDGYLITYVNGSNTGTNWGYYGTPLSLNTKRTLEMMYNRSTKACTFKLDGTTIRSDTAGGASTDTANFNMVIFGIDSTLYTGRVLGDNFLMKKV